MKMNSSVLLLVPSGVVLHKEKKVIWLSQKLNFKELNFIKKNKRIC